MGLNTDVRRDLLKRSWPGKVREEYPVSPYVREGRVFNRALQLQPDMSEPIPPGECAITSLATGRRGVVFGATSGARSHLFAYMGSGWGDGVYDLGAIEGAAAVRSSLVASASTPVVLGGISARTDRRKGGNLFTVRLVAPGSKEHRKLARKPRSENVPRLPPIEMLPPPVRGECVAAMALDDERGLAYGLSSSTATLFSVALESKEVTIRGRLTKEPRYSHKLVLDKRGRVYGAGPLGGLVRYDPDADRVETLDLSLPSVAGRDFYNQLDSAALDPVSGLIYGGGSADGVIFVFDPEAVAIRSLGKVTAEPRCPAIAVGLDGRVYGISGEPGGMAHLFCYDPETHELRDLGIPYASSDRPWHGYEFGAACTGSNGEIYLGESDRISHLFMYFPPVKRREVASTPQSR